MEKKGKSILITVGTTNFNSLIIEIDQIKFYEALIAAGYKNVYFQIGHGEYQPNKFEGYKDKLNIEVFKLSPEFTKYLQSSDLIVSHCGAGTILEGLRMKLSLLIVVNNSLMDNHQTELYDAIVDRDYAWGCKSEENVVAKVVDILNGKAVELKEYPQPQKNVLENVLEEVLEGKKMERQKID